MDFDRLAETISPDQLARALGAEKAGSGWRCPSPEHDDSDPSFSVFRDGGRTAARCHGCGLAGSPVTVAAEVWGVSHRDAAERLARELGLRSTGGRWSQDDADRALRHRGLRPETVERFGIVADLARQAWRFPVGGGRRFKRFGTGSPKSWWDGRKPSGGADLYGLDLVDPEAPRLLLVEGEPDVWVGHQAALPAVSFTGGATVVPRRGVEALAADGRPVTILYDADEPGLKGALKAARKLTEAGVEARVLQYDDLPPGGDLTDLYGLVEHDDAALRERVAGLPEAESSEEGVLIELPSNAAVFEIMSDVEPVEVAWLWPDRIPLGRLTILDGDPGLGKSTVTLDLAARVTRGHRMPDWKRGLDGPAGVVLLGAEDGLADTVRPRLDAAGADCTRVAALKAVRDGDGKPRLPTVADVGAIRAVAREVDAKLLVIDPLSAYMGAGVDGHRDIDVRTVLAGLAQLAEETGLAVLLVRHLNKSGGRNPLYRGGGSIAFIAAARSGLLLARDPDDADKLVLASTKASLAPLGDSLSLRLDTEDGRVRVAWSGRSERSASDLLSDPDRSGSAVDEATDFLRVELGSGPVPVSELKSTVREAGLHWRTVERAKERLGFKARKDGFGSDSKWVWELSHEDRQPSQTNGSQEELADYRECLQPRGLSDSEPPSESPEGRQGEDLAAFDGNAAVSEGYRGRTCDRCGRPIGATSTRCARCKLDDDEPPF